MHVISKYLNNHEVYGLHEVKAYFPFVIACKINVNGLVLICIY